ncbi:MAG: sigma-54 interaction domain-containing protein [Acidobacteriota bacterium]
MTELLGELERLVARLCCLKEAAGMDSSPAARRIRRLGDRLLDLLGESHDTAENPSAFPAAEHTLTQMIGESQAMHTVQQLIARIAPRSSNVLIQGESGTGKELVARAIHRMRGTTDHPFIPVDCGALSDTLLESELFGHRKGSFTGATVDRVGLFEEADGGTLFLDEIANASARFQTRLLRVLQERQVRRVGENHLRPLRLRVISATSGDLRRLVFQGRFREDLYYRLNVLSLDLPPLRERKEDIPALVEHFVHQCCLRHGLPLKRFNRAAMEILVRSPWPGNVRELENVVERSVLLVPGALISPGSLPSSLVDALLQFPEENGGQVRNKTGEQQMIERALLTASGDRSRAARLIGWHRTKLYRRLHQYRIPGDFGRDRPRRSLGRRT